MSNNRYAPPVAAVGDIAEEGPPRPLQVTWAVRLLWATTICSLPQLYAAAVHAPSTAGLIVTLAFEGLMIAFGCFLYVCIHRGRNWARIVTLILTVLSTAAGVLALDITRLPALEQAFDVINMAVDIVCMVLLFVPPSGAWFKARAAS